MKFKKFNEFNEFNEFINEENSMYTDKYADLTLSILQTYAQCKMLHWGTLSYSQHVTFCSFMKEFDKLGDSLIESIMGKYGRPLIKSSNIEILDYTQININLYFNNLNEYFTNSINLFNPKEKNEDIVNILAEIIALISKTRYLLTLNENKN